MAEVYTSLGESTLSGSINNSVTSLTVASAASFPTTGTFRIAIENEIMKVTGVTGAVFTVVRGQEGTTAASHSDGATVTEVATREMIDAIRADYTVSSGNLASLPGSPAKDGDIYIPDDGNIIFLGKSGAWERYGPFFPVTAPPAVSTLGAMTGLGGSQTGVDRGDGISLNSAGSTVHGKSLSLTTFRVEVGVLFVTPPADYGEFRMILSDSVAGKNVRYGQQHNGFYSVLNAQRFTTTTYNSTVKQTNYWYKGPWGSILYLAIREQGGTRYYETSVDGVNWQTFASTADTDHFSNPDEWGFEVVDSGTYTPVAARLIHWKETDLS